MTALDLGPMEWRKRLTESMVDALLTLLQQDPNEVPLGYVSQPGMVRVNPSSSTALRDRGLVVLRPTYDGRYYVARLTDDGRAKAQELASERSNVIPIRRGRHG